MKFLPGLFSHILHPETLFICIFQILLVCLGLAITFLALIWCVYFLRRASGLSSKIHQLKKQTDERCLDELKNARVDFIKSIFIAAISASEIIPSILALGFYGLPNIIDRSLVNNCSTNTYFDYSYNVPIYRAFPVAFVSSLIITLSLVHILTSYMTHAYSQQRIITLTYQEKLLFVWMLIELIVVWASIGNWKAFLFTLPIVLAILLSSHLYLYCTYSRRLYRLLKWRRLDAWFEDRDSFRKLDRMCKDYRRGTILYVISISFIATLFIYISLEELFERLLVNPCIITEVFGRNFNFLNNFYKEHNQAWDIVLRIIGKPIINSLALIVLLIQFSIHFSILYQMVWRIKQRNKALKNLKFNIVDRSLIYQPLVGRN